MGMKITLLTFLMPIAVEYAFDDGDKSLLEQSYQAFKCDLPRQSLVNREVHALDGLIVTGDDPDQYLELDITQRSGNKYIDEQSKANGRKNFLLRTISSKTRGILKDFPNIYWE